MSLITLLLKANCRLNIKPYADIDAIGHIDARVVGGPKLQNDWLALLELTQTEQALILQASIPDQMSLDTFRAYQAEVFDLLDNTHHK